MSSGYKIRDCWNDDDDDDGDGVVVHVVVLVVLLLAVIVPLLLRSCIHFHFCSRCMVLCSLQQSFDVF